MISIPKHNDDILSERLTRYTKEMLQWLLKRMSRHDAILCLKFALKLMQVSTDK